MTTIRDKENEPFDVAVKRHYKRIRSMQLPKRLY